MSNEVIFFVCTKESKQQKNKNIKKLKKVTEGKTEKLCSGVSLKFEKMKPFILF
jgi:hypothetical protein